MRICAFLHSCLVSGASTEPPGKSVHEPEALALKNTGPVHVDSGGVCLGKGVSWDQMRE